MSVQQSKAYAQLLAYLGIEHKIVYDNVQDFSSKQFFPRGYDLFVLDGVLGRLRDHNVRKVLDNLYKSGVRYAAITNYPAERERIEPINGMSRRLNMAHFGMRPLIMMSDGENGKTLTLYRISNGRNTTAK